jgi:hypothetical protein
MLSASLDRLLQESGAYETHHLGKRDLASHLRGTMYLLRIAGFEEAVCVGGLLHSLYGTNRFRTKSLSNAHERSKVIECAGVEAERLAFLFSTVNRPHSFRTFERKFAQDCDPKRTYSYLSDSTVATLQVVELTLRSDVDPSLLETYKLQVDALADVAATSGLPATILVDENTAHNLMAIEAANLLDQGARYLLTAGDPDVYGSNHPLPLAIHRIRSAADRQGLTLTPVQSPSPNRSQA